MHLHKFTSQFHQQSVKFLATVSVACNKKNILTVCATGSNAFPARQRCDGMGICEAMTLFVGLAIQRLPVTVACLMHR
jgi:hypothetical protein